jgi:hypothetical protein
MDFWLHYFFFQEVVGTRVPNPAQPRSTYEVARYQPVEARYMRDLRCPAHNATARVAHDFQTVVAAWDRSLRCEILQ